MYERLVALLEEVIGTTGLDEFHHGLLRGLQRAVPADWASLNARPFQWQSGPCRPCSSGRSSGSDR